MYIMEAHSLIVTVLVNFLFRDDESQILFEAAALSGKIPLGFQLPWKVTTNQQRPPVENWPSSNCFSRNSDVLTNQIQLGKRHFTLQLQKASWPLLIDSLGGKRILTFKTVPGTRHSTTLLNLNT